MPRADEKRARPQVHGVEFAALKTRDIGSRKHTDADVELRVLRRAGRHNALDDDDCGVRIVEEFLRRPTFGARCGVPDTATSKFLNHHRADFGGHEPPPGALESDDKPVATDDDRLQSVDRGFARDRSAHHRIDIEHEVCRIGAVLRRSGFDLLNHFAAANKRQKCGDRREGNSSSGPTKSTGVRERCGAHDG